VLGDHLGSDAGSVQDFHAARLSGGGGAREG